MFLKKKKKVSWGFWIQVLATDERAGTHLRGSVLEALAVSAVRGAALVILEVGAVAGHGGRTVLSLFKDNHTLLLPVPPGIVHGWGHENWCEIFGFHHRDS